MDVGFRKVAICYKDHFDVKLQEKIKQGQIRLEALAGQLLDEMADTGLSIPEPYPRIRSLKRRHSE